MELKLKRGKTLSFITNGKEKILSEAFARNLKFHISQANRDRVFAEIRKGKK